MRPVQRATYYLGLTNLAIGIAGFAGPLVTGNRDHLINIRPGFLLGVFAMNWLHALLHLVVGIAGLPSWRVPRSATGYMRLHTVLFGVLWAMGRLRVRGSSRIHMMMGMALNAPANVVHALWALIGLAFTLRRDARS
ncbi:MAG: DUF4383 domain-containing protein [Chloroflexota bacterium]|nr:DUF4383 domain-containing protein [Chloroflexota bacterium]